VVYSTLAEYSLFMLNAQAGLPDWTGVLLELPFVGPGIRGRAGLRCLPCRLSLVPVMLKEQPPARCRPDSDIASGQRTVSFGTEVNVLPAAIEPRGECFRQMSTAGVGRIIYTRRALPAVELVNFTLDGEDIVISTTRDDLASAAAQRRRVRCRPLQPGRQGRLERDRPRPVPRDGQPRRRTRRSRLVRDLQIWSYREPSSDQYEQRGRDRTKSGGGGYLITVGPRHPAVALGGL
jgi:hypothetical protein